MRSYFHIRTQGVLTAVSVSITRDLRVRDLSVRDLSVRDLPRPVNFYPFLVLDLRGGEVR